MKKETKPITQKQRNLSIAGIVLAIVLILFSIIFFFIKTAVPQNTEANVMQPNFNDTVHIEFSKLANNSIDMAKLKGLSEITEETYTQNETTSKATLYKFYNNKENIVTSCSEECNIDKKTLEGITSLKLSILQSTLNELYVEKIDDKTYEVTRAVNGSQPEIWESGGQVLVLNKGTVENKDFSSSWKTKFVYEETLKN